MAALKKEVKAKAPKKSAAPKPSNGSVLLPEAHIEVCASKGDVRYYLNWPYLDLSDKKKPMLVATNGHVLAGAPVQVKGSVQPGPIPLEAIAVARKEAKATGSTEIKLVFRDFMVGTESQMFKRPDGDFTYPDWRKVVPTPAVPEHDIAVNGEYIALMQKAIDVKPYNGGIKIFCQRDGKKIDPNKAMLIRGAAGESFGVVMPMRL